MNAEVMDIDKARPARTMRRRGTQWFVALGLLALILLVYWPGLGGGYVFDDFPNIVDNKALHVVTLDWHAWIGATMSSPAADLPRPLSMLSFALNHYVTGLDPRPMKLTNVAIHLLNTLLVLGVARALLDSAGAQRVGEVRSEWTARFVAAAWALHPINLMAVLFVVQRMESLSHTFVFAGLWLYLLGRRRQLDGLDGWALIIGGLLLGTGLGVLAKESAALLPLYAFCIEVCVFRFRSNGQHHDRRLALLFACVLFLPALFGVAWVLPKVLATGAFASRNFTLGERLLTEARVVLDYLQWSVFPTLGELSLYHDDYPVSRGLWSPPATLFALAGMALLAGAAWWLRLRRPLAALGLMWFLGAHLLTATVIPLELVFEHRNYFASFGICIVLADLLLLAPRTRDRQHIGGLVALLLLVMFAATTHFRAREWSDPYRFAASEAAKHPRSPRATYGLGLTLTTMSGYRADSPLLQPARAALERASRVPGGGILPHSGLLLLAANTGMPLQEQWWAEIQQRLRQRPPGPQEIAAIGSLTRCARNGVCHFPPGRMLATYEAALGHGRHPEILTMYGDYALNVQNDGALALHLWQEAAMLRPRIAQYRVNLIKLLVAMGRHDAARGQIAELREVGRLGQNEAIARGLESRLAAAQDQVRGSSAKVGD